MKMADGHLRECYSTNAEHQCICDAEYFIKQRDKLAWAIAWFLKGGSKEKLAERFADYEKSLNV